MRGRINGQSNLFVKINLEGLVPVIHPSRGIERLAKEALAVMVRTFAAAYCPLGRPGPARTAAQGAGDAQLVHGAFRAGHVRADHLRHALRWFLDMTPDEPCFDHSDFTSFHARPDAPDIYMKFSDQIVIMASEAGLVRQGHFSIDGSLLRSHSSLGPLYNRTSHNLTAVFLRDLRFLRALSGLLRGPRYRTLHCNASTGRRTDREA